MRHAVEEAKRWLERPGCHDVRDDRIVAGLLAEVERLLAECRALRVDRDCERAAHASYREKLAEANKNAEDWKAQAFAEERLANEARAAPGMGLARDRRAAPGLG